MKTICVYAGSNLGNHKEFKQKANELGELIVERGYRLVYGGSSIGLMGEVANQVLARGGEAIGVIPKGLFIGEMAHPNLTQLIEVNNMHERKAKMSELADGFIALPGGIGTFEELFETYCWAQIGIHQKPIGVLNIQNYYQSFIDLVHRSVDEEFANPSHLHLLNVAASPDILLDKMEAYTPPVLGNKWKQLDGQKAQE